MANPGREFRLSSRRVALAALLGASLEQARSAETSLRMGLSGSLAQDVNVVDARAAMTFWIRNLVTGMDFEVILDADLFDSAPRLEARLREGQLDAVGINFLEYRRMARLLDPRQIAIPVFRSRFEYVLLVAAGARLTALSGLAGQRLMMLDSLAACAAPAWLNNLLAAESNGDRFFREVIRKTKPSQVILPVFFGQAAACLTTYQSFTTMAELNPQVGKRLRPLLVSPEVVHSLYAFRKGWNPPARDKVVRMFSKMDSTTVGRQVMTMFQCDSLAVRDASCLESTLAILAQSDRLAEAKGAGG
ncbi:MAG: PhnD/SsuA/transferrin family substrate-binding protein [Bryobacterales bacterium]|nr:PhnD/SsuA/transferrin family substrate-binding protein [Bryobacterales bacterium]